MTCLGTMLIIVFIKKCDCFFLFLSLFRCLWALYKENTCLPPQLDSGCCTIQVSSWFSKDPIMRTWLPSFINSRSSGSVDFQHKETTADDNNNGSDLRAKRSQQGLLNSRRFFCGLSADQTPFSSSRELVHALALIRSSFILWSFNDSLEICFAVVWGTLLNALNIFKTRIYQ